MAKVVSTMQLLKLARTADRLKFNRCLDTSKLEQDIDPDGLHILEYVMDHSKVGTVLHVRTRVYIKLKGSVEPASAFLDVRMSDFGKLTDAEKVLDELREVKE